MRTGMGTVMVMVMVMIYLEFAQATMVRWRQVLLLADDAEVLD